MCTVTDHQTVAVWSLLLCRVPKLWISTIVRPSACVWFGVFFFPLLKYKVLSAGRPILHLCFLHWKCFDAGWIVRLHQAGAAWMIKKKSWCLWAKVWRWVIGWVHDGVTEGRRRCETSRGAAAFTPPAARSPSPQFLVEQPGLHRLLPCPSKKELWPFWACRVLIQDPLPRGNEEALQTSCDLLKQHLKYLYSSKHPPFGQTQEE